MATAASGRSTEKFAILETTSARISPRRNCCVNGVALRLAGGARQERQSQFPREAFHLLHIHPDDQHGHVAVPLEQLADQAELAGVLRGDAEFVARLRHRVFHAALLGHGQADFGADGLRNPALLLHLLPGHVVFLGADEGEDFVLHAVLANQRGGQAQAAGAPATTP